MLIVFASWTIVYDTMYAYQDREDDIKVGIKSTAVLFGSWIKPILVTFAGLFVLCMIIAGYINQQRSAYFIISCGGATLHFLHQFLTWDLGDATAGGYKFLVCHIFGMELPDTDISCTGESSHWLHYLGWNAPRLLL